MPQGKGTYGSKVGRPRKNPDKERKKKLDRQDPKQETEEPDMKVKPKKKINEISKKKTKK